MNQYERGKHVPDLATIRRIAQALDVPVAYLFAEDDLAEVIQHFHALPKKERREFANQIKPPSD
jgi:transcriptional regulator with XRE-family HTH domain